MAYFHYSTDGTTWKTDLPVPAKLSGSMQDLDRDSYRSVTSGNIKRTVINYKWQKISFKFNYLTASQAQYLAQTLKQANNVYIKTNSPLITSGSDTILKGYISTLDWEMVKSISHGDGYTVNFNFVEGTR